ncbi:MAG: hypothetical protein ACRDDM_01465, partial [Paraclostridium sp.]
SSNKRDLEEANKQCLSLGRYLAKLKISDYRDRDIDIEKLSVEQILSMLKNEKYLYLHEEVKVDLRDKIEDTKEDTDEKYKTNVIEVEGDNKDGDKAVDENDESNQAVESDTSVITKQENNNQENNNQENNSQQNNNQEDQDNDNHQDNDNYNDERHNGKHNKDKNSHDNKNNHHKNKNKHNKDKNYGWHDDDDEQ